LGDCWRRETERRIGAGCGFPDDPQRSARKEQYGLTSQLRRGCSSTPANLVEGCGRNGDAGFARFSWIAMGSASELEYHLLLAKDLKPIQPKDHAELSERATELKRMLTALLPKLKADR